MYYILRSRLSCIIYKVQDYHVLYIKFKIIMYYILRSRLSCIIYKV